jgi:hypothetical protein
MGVNDLAIGPKPPKSKEHAFGLQTFTDRGRVKPDERSTSIAVPARPVEQTISCMRTCADGRRNPGVEDA